MALGPAKLEFWHGAKIRNDTCSFKASTVSEARERAQFKTKSTFPLHRNSMACQHQKSRSCTTSHYPVTGEKWDYLAVWWEKPWMLKLSAHSWLETNKPKSKGNCCCCFKLHSYIRYSSITYYIIWYYKYLKSDQATSLMLKIRELLSRQEQCEDALLSIHVTVMDSWFWTRLPVHPMGKERTLPDNWVSACKY